jgi:hypothetical protein
MVRIRALRGLLQRAVGLDASRIHPNPCAASFASFLGGAVNQWLYQPSGLGVRCWRILQSSARPPSEETVSIWRSSFHCARRLSASQRPRADRGAPNLWNQPSASRASSGSRARARSARAPPQRTADGIYTEVLVQPRHGRGSAPASCTGVTVITISEWRSAAACTSSPCRRSASVCVFIGGPHNFGHRTKKSEGDVMT